MDRELRSAGYVMILFFSYKAQLLNLIIFFFHVMSVRSLPFQKKKMFLLNLSQMKLTKPGQKNMVFFLALSRLGFTSVVHVVFNSLCWFIYLKNALIINILLCLRLLFIGMLMLTACEGKTSLNSSAILVHSCIPYALRFWKRELPAFPAAR